MINELRTYRYMAGRKPGAAVVVRERDVAGRNIGQAGFWTTVIGKSSQENAYMLVRDSTVEREKRWGVFSR